MKLSIIQEVKLGIIAQLRATYEVETDEDARVNLLDAIEMAWEDFGRTQTREARTA